MTILLYLGTLLIAAALIIVLFAILEPWENEKASDFPEENNDTEPTVGQA